MPTFLWTSRTLGAGATASDHIAKYCWNAPGNWRVFNDTTSVWEETTEVPGQNTLWSDIIIGAEYRPDKYGKFATGISYSNGWTHAKHPLLFGGFYMVPGNSLERGNFNYSSGQTQALDLPGIQYFHYSVGVTSMCGGPRAFELDEIASGGAPLPYKQLGITFPNTGYSFPYLGGGISGEIAEWCAARDGLTVGNYVVENYPGFHDPTAGLNLYIQTGSEFYLIDTRIAGLAGNTSTYDPFKGVINIIKQGKIEYPNQQIYSNMQIFTFNGSGFVLNGGKWSTMAINSPATSDLVYASRFYCYPPLLPAGNNINEGALIANRHKRYEDLVDHGIVINNAIVKNCYISNANSVKLRGGDYAKIEIKNIGYAPRIYFTSLRDTYPVQGSVIEYSPNNFYKVAVSSPAQIILANGWNWANVAWLISRVPNNQLDSDPTWSGSVYGSDPETWSLSLRGQLDLKLKLSPWVANAPSNSLLYSYSEPGVIDTRTLIRYPGNTSTFGSTYTYDGVEIAKLPSPMDSYDATRQRSRVIIGDPDDSTFQFGNTGTYDPFGTMFGNCRINCNYKYTGTQNSVRNSFIPWSLEFISGGRIQNIRNKGGIVKPHDDLPSDAVVRIGQIKMQNNATVILNNTNGNADIRVGLLQYAPGFSGSASGAYFQGGIVSDDYTNNRIRGTNLISWGTGIDTGYNVRQSFAGEVNAPGATFTIQTNSV